MQQGEPLGPSTLLKKLHGDYIDKDELHRRLAAPKKCAMCGQKLSAMFFTPEQWFGHAKDRRVCIACTKDGAPCVNSDCSVRIKGEEAWNRKAVAKRFCAACCRKMKGGITHAHSATRCSQRKVTSAHIARCPCARSATWRKANSSATAVGNHGHLGTPSRGTPTMPAV